MKSSHLCSFLCFSQDGKYFGPLKFTEAYCADTMPALITNIGESHLAIREYTIAALRERLGVTETALFHASDNFYKDLKADGKEREATGQSGVLFTQCGAVVVWIVLTLESQKQSGTEQVGFPLTWYAFLAPNTWTSPCGVLGKSRERVRGITPRAACGAVFV